MTAKHKKFLLITGASLAGSIGVLAIASILIFQSAWFSNFVKNKIISVAEESTGGKVDINSFQFDWRHLTVRIHNFVLHGTEPSSTDPLLRVSLLELRLKLLAGLKQAVDLQYLGIQQLQVNLIVFPDGTTNIPQPKVQKQPSQKSGLETVVDLAVNQFEIQDGLLLYSQRKTPFNARGENLRVLLSYNSINPAYQGNLIIDPLLLTAGNGSPLNVHVSLPINLEKDAVTLAGGHIDTSQSHIVVDASLQDLNAPVISAHVNASVALPEMQRTFNLPLDISSNTVPKTLTAEFAARMEEKSNIINVQTAHLALGQTTFQASGVLDPAKQSAVQFNGNLALAELGRLLKVVSPQLAGALQLNGAAKLDAQNNYAVDGTFNSRDLSLRSGTTQLLNIGLYSPFHADPYLISLDGLKLNVLGGGLTAKVFIEKLQQLSVEGHLHNLSIPVLTAALTGKRLGYDGTLNGSLAAKGNMQMKGARGYSATAHLTIAPGQQGVPVSGVLKAAYSGATGAINIAKSYLALPHSHLDVSGSLNKQIDLHLVSGNLNDFLPAANFGAAKPQSSFPVTLQSGNATLQAQITGDLASPRVSSHLDVNRFAVQQRLFDRLALDMSAAPSGAAIQNGILTRGPLQTNFDGSMGLTKWEPLPHSALTANLTLRNGDLGDLLSLACQSSAAAAGQVSADVHINGTYGDPVGSANLQVANGSAYNQPFSRISANVSLADQLITLANLELDSAGGRMNASGTFRHPRDSFGVGHAELHVRSNDVQLANVVPLRRQNAGVAGLIQLSADAAADLRKQRAETKVTISNINADFAARNLRVQNQDAGNLTATARTKEGNVNYDLKSDFAGSNIQVNGRTALTDDYKTVADAAIQNLSVQRAMLIAGQSAIPIQGNLSASAHLSGPLLEPNAALDFNLSHANVYQEPVNSLLGSVRYSNTLVDIPTLKLDLPAGSINLTGSFTHPASDLNSGSLTLRVSSTEIQVAKLEHAQQAKPGLAGTLHLATNLSAALRNQNNKPEVLISNLDADASANDLRVDARKLGNATLTAKTNGSTLNFRLDSDLANSEIHGAGQSQLTGNYLTRADLSFKNIRYANIAPFVSSEPSVKPAFDALVEGNASLNGPVLNSDALDGRLQLDRLTVRTNPQGSPTGAPPVRTVDFANDGPVIINLNHSVLQVQQLRIQGPHASLTASGGINLKDSAAPLALKLNANGDLGVLQDIDRDFYSSGNVDLDAVIRGSFAQPLVNGRIDLKNANVNYTGSPNGLANGNGVILLNGTNATIQNLTGESGGGKVAVTGFVGFGTSVLNYNLKAAATKVRTRYSGISVTSSAALSLTGNSRHSLLGGTVTIQRIAYSSSSDAGSILSTASTPPSTPTAPSLLLVGMRLDIRVVTAPDLRVVTTYADRLEIFSNLAIRGTAALPGIVGVVNVTNGDLVFFGNTYTVNTGTINFYNPNAIDPILNVSLETTAQGVDVTLGVSGPMNNLKLSYRSDPPLSFEQIVQLLATNTTPSDPTIAAHEPTPPQQSLSQMGESAVLGQAVANPLASRVQRVFGLTQFKIDPSFSGSNGQPSARVTLQQKIASNVTFTYITDVTQTNSEIVRVEWDLTPRFSAVGLRDFNGNVSVEFFYKFKVQ